MLAFNTKKAKETGQPEPIAEVLLQMVKDLEDTREIYQRYSYVRTMRNILAGKESALIAPYFKTKPYYGLFEELKLEETEYYFDNMVRAGLLDVIHTDHGKLYCTHEFYENMNRK